MKKASIVIVTKNNERHIAKLLESLAYQDFKNFEVIIVDLCSTDRTLSCAKSFPVKVFRLESGERSIVESLNLVSKICIGENIFCLKGNNIPLYQNFISSGIKTLSRPKAVLSFGKRFIENEAPIVRLMSLESWDSPNDEDQLISYKKIRNICFDVCAYKKFYWQKCKFLGDEKTGIWIWALKMLNEDLEIYYQPRMSIITHGKTGLINYFREKSNRNKLFTQFKEKVKNELSD